VLYTTRILATVKIIKKLVDNDQLAVFNSLHKTNASPSLMLEKKRELGLEI